MTKTRTRWHLALIAAATAATAAACGGGGGDGTGAGTAAVAVSGTVASETEDEAGAAPAGTYRVRAVGSSGRTYETDTDPDNGRFTLMLPADTNYLVGFEHREMMDREIHFAGYMVFRCGDGESDHFFLSGREPDVDLGTILVGGDGGFARPGRNPLDQLDQDRDGTPDGRDADTRCADVGDDNHDGFYDDDMDRDGHHDDDMNGDGQRDCEMGDEMDDMMGDEMGDGMDDMMGDNDACRTPGTSGTPTMSPVADPTPTPDDHGHTQER